MKQRFFILLLLVLVLTSVPFLGLTDFNTKGEPREAVVALSMLQSDNWILPCNNGGEMAYKPPFFHWCIAAVSTVTGGRVTEFTSRFPSAVFAVAMLMACFVFFAKRRDERTALMAMLLAYTSFEVHRAVFACRVDMVLTACIVLAILLLYSWYERGLRFGVLTIPWLAILFMSLGTLTKGPVAIILPCGIMGLFLLIKRNNILVVSGKLIFIALLSLVIPMLWYYAAYLQGGDDFLMLVKEENVDRFLGKMSYASHENGWTYNLMMLVLGFLPWTLLCLVSLFFAKKSWFCCSGRKTLAADAKCPAENSGKDESLVCRVKRYAVSFYKRLNEMEAYRLYSLIVIVLVFVFYCIPKSKRGVYLLPIYPFIAYFIMEFILWLKLNCTKAIKIFGWFVSAILCIAALAVFVAKVGLIPDALFTGKHAADNLLFVKAIANMPFLSSAVAVLLPLAGFVIWYRMRNLNAVFCMILFIFLFLDSTVQPALLNVKSDKQIAFELRHKYPDNKIDSYVEAPMMHYFTINFYDNDNIGVFDPNRATEGLLLIGHRDAENFLPSLDSAFEFELLEDTGKKSCDTRQKICLYRYKRR